MADKKISALTGAATPLAGTEVLPIVQSGSTVKVAVSDLTAGRTVTASGVNVTGLTASNAVATDAGKNLVSVANTGSGSNVLASGPTFSSATTGTTVATFNGLYAGSGSVVLSQWQRNGGAIAAAISYDDNLTSINFGTTTNHELRIYVNNAEVAQFFPSGGVAIGTSNSDPGAGNLAFSTAAKGVNFTANTPAAGMTSQLLNWYEEGTWTPSIANSFNNYTHTIQVGRYTRVGNLVTLQFTIAWTTTNAGALTFIIEGLPFTPVTLTNYASAGAIGVVDNLTDTNQIVCQIESATSQIKFYARTSGSTAAALASSNWNTAGSTNKVSGTISYQV